MPTIQVLDAHVADLIAAGEVVERPASVAKELMENAIDAGASAVTVEISHGGMTFLRVTDDGCGIPAAQLKTAFLRHATSKLRTEYDLEAIGTLGFRGEALAAISAVSRIELLTRTAEEDLGAALSLEGGAVVHREEAGCPQGTTMVVRDLFYNTPARLKFLKKDAAEGAACFAMVQRVALSHPEVSVKFLRDGKQELLTPGNGQVQSALYAVLGRDMALGFTPVKGSGEDMSVSGFVSLPTCCRGTRGYQHFFVNGRYVKSRTMTAALEEAYANQKMVGKFPGCVLHLTTRLNAVDVNVHPTKQEVKFGSDKKVFDAVYYAVKSTLEADRTRPSLQVKPPRPAEGGRPAQSPLCPAERTPAAPAYREMTLEEFRRTAERPAAPLPLHDFTAERPAPQVVKPQAASGKMQPPAAAPASPAPTVRSGETASPPPSETEPRPGPKAEAPAAPKPEPVPQPQPEPEIVPWRVAGEVLNTYILVEQGDRVLFIDKHAAHERMNFDRMKAQGYRPMAQSLLTPAVFRLPAEEQMALLDRRDLLAEFGFDVDELGGCIAVRQAPFDVPAGEVEATLSDLAQKLLTGGADPDAARDELLHTMSCKAAIKGGWRTSAPELEKIAAAVVSGQVKYCPHGRPVAIELTRAQLEKQFKRT